MLEFVFQANIHLWQERTLQIAHVQHVLPTVAQAPMVAKCVGHHVQVVKVQLRVLYVLGTSIRLLPAPPPPIRNVQTVLCVVQINTRSPRVRAEASLLMLYVETATHHVLPTNTKPVVALVLQTGFALHVLPTAFVIL